MIGSEEKTVIRGIGTTSQSLTVCGTSQRLA